MRVWDSELVFHDLLGFDGCSILTGQFSLKAESADQVILLLLLLLLCVEAPIEILRGGRGRGRGRTRLVCKYYESPAAREQFVALRL